jgi:hypothetical protein
MSNPTKSIQRTRYAPGDFVVEPLEQLETRHSAVEA